MVLFRRCCVCRNIFPETEITLIEDKFYCSKDIPGEAERRLYEKVFGRPGVPIEKRRR